MILVPALALKPATPPTTWDPANKDAAIALSGGNLIATISGAGWKSVIGTGTGKTSGKWYFRVSGTVGNSSYITGAICTKTEPTSSYVGASDANGWISYAQVTGVNTTSAIQNNGTVLAVNARWTHAVASGDWTVCAYDADNGKIWFTGMTAAGSLDTQWNWNGSAGGSPATGSGGFSLTVTPGTALLPAASLLTSGDAMTLDVSTVVSDSTLTGFSPWG